MNQGVTKSDNGVSEQTISPVSTSDTPKNLLFALKGEQIPVPPAGYELIEEIGRGGMGLVYRARDLSFDRDIALKFLQLKYQAGSLNALRFLDEARITGQLQHPGIPAVHQVGKLADERPYLVMKLIKGYTLSDLIWKKDGTLQSVDGKLPHVFLLNYLSIFEAICQAVGYAHAHGVIHRDLKPHNIMVGAFGEVQVMDWGLAKVLKHDVEPASIAVPKDDSQVTSALPPPSLIQSSGSELTTAGSVLGTPSYMPPEQAIGANELLDARSDVFGLGAILCVLLTGKPPFQGDSSESTRLQAAMGMLGDCFDRLDASGADPDLIALTKRCLAAERKDRPDNGGAVAKEIARLRAAADDRARQAEIERTKAEMHVHEQRRLRRVLLIAAAALITVLSIGIVGTTWGLIRADANEKAEAEQRKKAETKEAETSKVLQFVSDKILSAARPDGLEQGLGRDVKLRDALETSLKHIADDFKASPVIEARIRQTLGKSFWYLGEHDVANEQLHRSLELFEEYCGPHDRETLLVLLVMANIDDRQERHQLAMERRERVYRLANEHYGINEHVTQMAMNNLSISYFKLGRTQDVLKLSEEVHQLTMARLGLTNAFTMLSKSNLGLAYVQMGKYEDGLKLLREALALQKQHLGPSHPNTLDTMDQLATILDILGKHPEALPIHEEGLRFRIEKLGPDHPATLTSETHLAHCYSCLVRNEDALKLLLDAVPHFEKRYGLKHSETLNCLWAVVARYFDCQRSTEAIPVIDTCLQRATDPKVNPTMINSLMLLRFRHYRQERNLEHCLQTLEMWTKRDLKRADHFVDQAVAWAVVAQFKRDKDKAAGQAEEDRAMVLLQQAVTAGWKDAKQLDEKEEFAALRQREDYQKLLANLKKAAEEKKPDKK